MPYNALLPCSGGGLYIDSFMEQNNGAIEIKNCSSEESGVEPQGWDPDPETQDVDCQPWIGKAWLSELLPSSCAMQDSDFDVLLGLADFEIQALRLSKAIS